ncbi:hypothetical protein AAES_75880 [Amazona aestiva]|uniref:Uncharacterized protein n=1 Tax=Amazona aestiva TaxID=12930 RepID=A0A0Q3MHI3_AMAAE|nr:hypothetical protein AAES_75880 [Amazona aestiva]
MIDDQGKRMRLPEWTDRYTDTTMRGIPLRLQDHPAKSEDLEDLVIQEAYYYFIGIQLASASVFSTDLIFETKACGVTDTSFSYQRITLPRDDSKWEIILKCREPGEGEDHANKPCWRASEHGDLWLKGASEQDKLVEAVGEVDGGLYIFLETWNFTR